MWLHIQNCKWIFFSLILNFKIMTIKCVNSFTLTFELYIFLFSKSYIGKRVPLFSLLFSQLGKYWLLRIASELRFAKRTDTDNCTQSRSRHIYYFSCSVATFTSSNKCFFIVELIYSQRAFNDIRIISED